MIFLVEAQVLQFYLTPLKSYIISAITFTKWLWIWYGLQFHNLFLLGYNENGIEIIWFLTHIVFITLRVNQGILRWDHQKNTSYSWRAIAKSYLWKRKRVPHEISFLVSARVYFYSTASIAFVCRNVLLQLNNQLNWFPKWSRLP